MAQDRQALVARGDGRKRTVGLAATTNKIGGMLMLTRFRKDNIASIALRRMDHVLLGRILVDNNLASNGLWLAALYSVSRGPL